MHNSMLQLADIYHRTHMCLLKRDVSEAYTRATKTYRKLAWHGGSNTSLGHDKPRTWLLGIVLPDEQAMQSLFADFIEQRGKQVRRLIVKNSIILMQNMSWNVCEFD